MANLFAAQLNLVARLAGEDPLAWGREPGASDGTSSSLQGVNVRERLVRRLEQSPGHLAERFLELMDRELGPSSTTSGAEVAEQRPCPLQYFERYGAYADCWELGHVQYTLSHILKYLWSQDIRRAADGISVLMCMIQQASLDGGVVDLGYLYTLLPDPPGESVSREPSRSSIRQSPRIADADRTSAVLGYLSTMDTIAKKRAEQLAASRKGGGGRPTGGRKGGGRGDPGSAPG